MTHRTLFPPPDENRALEQLERLHREIQRARRDRERAGTEFDGFVQELRTPADPAAPMEPVSRRATRPIPPATKRTPVVSPAKPVAPGAPASGAIASEEHRQAPSKLAEPRDAHDVLPALAPPRRGVRQRLLLPVAATVLVGGLAVVYFWQRAHTPIAPAVPETASSRPPSPVVPAAPQNSRAAAAPAVSPSTVQLSIDRTVWLRVIVDGRRVVERELKAGEHLTFTPSDSIVIRAGDAGAVRVKVGSGVEHVLGRDAFPVTRSFAAPKP